MPEVSEPTESQETTQAEATRLMLRGVDLRPGEDGDTPLKALDLTLGIGEMVIVQAEPDRPRLPLADAILGLSTPDAGEILVDGTYWARLSPRQATHLRSQIGRVFDQDRWLSGRTLEENVYLAAEYHQQMTLRQMQEEAHRLSQMFGLSELPDIIPSHATPGVRQKVAWIRALLGPRRLLILERPLKGVSSDDARALGMALGQLREQGAAVVWITDVPVPIDWPGMFPDMLARVVGSHMTVEPGPRPLET